jgi:hypothetical protein
LRSDECLENVELHERRPVASRGSTDVQDLLGLACSSAADVWELEPSTAEWESQVWEAAGSWETQRGWEQRWEREKVLKRQRSRVVRGDPYTLFPVDFEAIFRAPSCDFQNIFRKLEAVRERPCQSDIVGVQLDGPSDVAWVGRYAVREVIDEKVKEHGTP